MSLRDQLLNTGLVSSKEAKRVNRELKKERKERQSKRESKKAIEEKIRLEKEQNQQEIIAAKIEAKRKQAELMEALARKHQVMQILLHHRIRYSAGNQKFWHKSIELPKLNRLDLPEWIANDLRAGKLAVGALETWDGLDYVLVPRDIAERVIGILPNQIVFFNRELPLDIPEEQLL